MLLGVASELYAGTNVAATDVADDTHGPDVTLLGNDFGNAFPLVEIHRGKFARRAAARNVCGALHNLALFNPMGAGGINYPSASSPVPLLSHKAKKRLCIWQHHFVDEELK